MLRLRRDYGLTRVAVVDVDGHHGDGTQELFYDQPVLCLSLHQYDGRFFPGTGGADEVGWGHGYGYSVNVGLPAPHRGRLPTPRSAPSFPAALRRYRPEAILLNFGVDGHFADPLVRLSLSTATYRAVAATVHALAHELCAGRLSRLRQRWLPPPARRPLLGDDAGVAGGRPPGGDGPLAGAAGRAAGRGLPAPGGHGAGARRSGHGASLARRCCP